MHPDQKYGDRTFSQNGEDLVLVNLFDQLGIEQPSYLDIGAHHPKNISNTALFYSRGCKGINVEANVNLVPQFLIDRGEDLNIHMAVWPTKEKKETSFYTFDDFSGRNTCSFEEAVRVEEELGESLGLRITKTIAVPCITIDEIVNTYTDGVWPDFLNIDVEGLDYLILKNSEFSVIWGPKIICVEVMRDNKSMHELMFSRNYAPVMRLGVNILYMNGMDWDKIQDGMRA